MITVNIPSVRSHVVHDRKFRPWHLSGLAMWLDGADAASIALDGSNNVSQWNDKSGNGRHVTQATSGSRPAYITAGINGLNCLSFDGSDDLMVTSGSSTISQPNTTFVVFRPIAGGTNPQLFDGSSARQYIYFPSTTSVQAYANSALTPTITSVVGTTSQAAVVFNGSSSVFLLNRVQISSGNLGSSGIGPEITIGANRFGGGPWKGYIAEHLIYRRMLDASEIMQLGNYLATKWGTP